MNQASLVLILAFVLGALLPFAVRPLLHALYPMSVPRIRFRRTGAWGWQPLVLPV